jgi:hypothetical protein
VVPAGVPLDVFEFVPANSGQAPSYIAFYADNGQSFSFPQGQSYSYDPQVDSYFAAYAIFAPDGEVTDPSVGAFSDFDANAFIYGGNAAWTGTGYVVYDGSAFPAAYDGTATMQSLDLEFYSPFVVANSRLYVTVTMNSISDYFVGDADPTIAGTWQYDAAGFGNPITRSAAPDGASTAGLLALGGLGAILLGQWKRRPAA